MTMKHKRISYTQVVWEITRLLQEAESLEDALRTSLGEVVKAVGAEAGTIWFYNSAGDQRIYPSFSIGGADLTGMSLAAGEGIAGTVVQEGKTTVVKDCQSDERWAGRFDEATGYYIVAHYRKSFEAKLIQARPNIKHYYSELKNDLKVVEYISSFYAQGQRNISTMKVRHAANIMMRNGADTGNMKAVNDGATLLFKLDRLDQPETPEELGDELIRMPVVITSDVKKKFPNKTSHDTEEMKKIRKRWGVKIDQWQDMVEDEDGVYIPDGDESSLQMEADADTDEETGQDNFTQPGKEK